MLQVSRREGEEETRRQTDGKKEKRERTRGWPRELGGRLQKALIVAEGKGHMGG